jgi:ABC-type lipoprotein export system ATPase subunit
LNGFDIYLYPSWNPKTTSEFTNIKSIMVIGETGSGKSTLLNGMVNYLCRVNKDSSFRYKLVDERDIQKISGT